MKIFTLIQLSTFAVVVFAISQSAVGGDLYAATAGSGQGELLILDPATGGLITDVGPLNDSTARNFGMTGLAFDPVSGVLYGSSASGNPDQTTRNQLVTINPATGLVTPIGDFGISASMSDIAFDPITHVLYGIGTVGGAHLYSINPTTAVATKVGDSGFTQTNGGGLAISNSGVVYGTPLPANFGTYDETTGAFTNIANPDKPNGRGYGALKFNGNVLYGMEVGSASTLVTIDTVTGAVTNIGATTVFNIDGIAFKASAPLGVPGDYNSNGVVDAADYVRYRDSIGQSTLPNRSASITGPVGPADYSFWRSHFGNTSGSGAGELSSSPVPEPSSVLLVVVGLLCKLSHRSKAK